VGRLKLAKVIGESLLWDHDANNISRACWTKTFGACDQGSGPPTHESLHWRSSLCSS